LVAEAEGFARSVSPELVVTIGQSAELNLSLQPATIGEQITVEASTELIERARTATATTIDQMRIDNLPINGRNYLSFSLLTSTGVRDNSPAIGPAPTSGINFGGQRARSNNVQVDGADNNDNSVNTVRATVSQEAVQEFQVVANGYNAEFGRASGGVINIITRSGSNEVRGTVFGFLRHRSFQARNPFSNESDPAFTRVQAGSTLGGPIVRDRTFFFFSYETTRRQETGFTSIGQDGFGLVRTQLGGAVGLLTPAQASFVTNQAVPLNVRSGYFSALAAASNTALFGSPVGAGGPKVFPSGTPLPASFTPVQRLVGLNYPISEGTTFYLAKLDHQLNPENRLSLRYSFTPSRLTGIETNAQNQTFGQNAFSRTSFQDFRDTAVVGQITTTVTPTSVNEWRFQFARRGLLLGFADPAVAVNINGFAFFGREPFSPVDRVERRYQVADIFSYLYGNHSFKVGGDINVIQGAARFELNVGGLYNFGELPGSVVGVTAAPPIHPLQAYGLGLPQNFLQGFNNPNSRIGNKTFAVFAQDSWRAIPRLTINYGVRYDVELTPVFRAATPLSQAAEDALGILEGIPRDTNNVQPRLALAWDPKNDGKTVVRAAYGIFYGHPLLALAFNSNVADGTQLPQLIAPFGAPGPTAFNAGSIFQGVLNFPGYIRNQQRFDPATQRFQTQDGLLATSPVLPFTLPVARDFKYDYAQQASLSIERQISTDVAVSVGYAFVKGTHLNRPVDVNTPIPELLLRNKANAVRAGEASPTDNPLTIGAFDPDSGVVPPVFFNFFRPTGPNFALFRTAFGLTEAQVRALASQLGLPQGPNVFVPFGPSVLQESSGSSAYHALTVSLNKRFSHHTQLLASYTFSKAIDDSTDLQSLLQPQDNRRPDLERGLSNFDQRHRFVFSGVLQSPYKRSDDGGWRKFLADFTFAPIVELSSGRPFTILTGVDTNLDFSFVTDRPNVIGPPDHAHPFGVFALPGEGQSGSLGRNTALRPGFASVDFRLTRAFFITEKIHLDVIAEMFNSFNRFNVSDVNNNFTRPGEPTAAFAPRQAQFALKLHF
jgi:hypothetical protein